MKNGWVARILGPDLKTTELSANVDGEVAVLSSILAGLGGIESRWVGQSRDMGGAERFTGIGSVLPSDGVFVPVVGLGFGDSDVDRGFHQLDEGGELNGALLDLLGWNGELETDKSAEVGHAASVGDESIVMAESALVAVSLGAISAVDSRAEDGGILEGRTAQLMERWRRGGSNIGNNGQSRDEHTAREMHRKDFGGIKYRKVNERSGLIFVLLVARELEVVCGGEGRISRVQRRVPCPFIYTPPNSLPSHFTSKRASTLE